MNVVVTGATGYIGLNLLHELETTDHTPIAVVRESSRTEILPSSVTTVTGDITAPDTLDAAFERGDAVAHLAATIPGSDDSEDGRKGVDWDLSREVNVEGTKNVLQKAAEHAIESVVYTSTTRAHPAVPEFDHFSPYVQSKQEADALFLEQEHEFDVTVVHPTYVIGPRDYHLKRYGTFVMVESNRVLIPPLYIPGQINIVPMRDVTRSLIEYIHQPANDRVVLSGSNIRLREYIRKIASLTTGRRVTLPLPGHRHIIPLVVDAGHALNMLSFDGSTVRENLARDIGVVPSHLENQVPVTQTPWENAIENTYEWYKSVSLL